MIKLNKKIGHSEMAISTSEIKLYKDRVSFYLYIINELHKYMDKQLFFVDDTDADKDKNQINELVCKFTSSEMPTRLEHFFEQYKNIISAHLDKGKKYVYEKEIEFKDIIKILTKGIYDISCENKEFNTDIVVHSSKLKEITLLNDIKKIKNGLELEVDQVNNAVKKKTKQDTKSLKMLSAKVTILNDDLKKAEVVSMTDRLTGVFNRLAFDNHIAELIEKMKTRLTTFSAIIIDIDNFKKVNDTYGHLVGDSVIISAVQSCKKKLRSNDFMARYGGEEFVIIMEGASMKISQRRANEICETISKTPFVMNDNASYKSLSFTVSIGVSVFRVGDTPPSIIDRADKALYKAKETGKNRVVTEDQPE